MKTWGEYKAANLANFQDTFELINERPAQDDLELFRFRLNQGVLRAFESILTPNEFCHFAAGAMLEIDAAHILWKSVEKVWPTRLGPVTIAKVSRKSAAEAVLFAMLRYWSQVAPIPDDLEVNSDMFKLNLNQLGLPTDHLDLIALRDDMHNRLIKQRACIAS